MNKSGKSCIIKNRYYRNRCGLKNCGKKSGGGVIFMEPFNPEMLKKGDTICGGLYEISENAKKGGAAFVYKARHTKWDVDMAIKIPKKEIRENFNNDFKEECKVWMDLGIHPNITFFYYAREIYGQLAAFYEWTEGGTLSDAVASGELYTIGDAQKTILHTAIQIMRGLSYLHSHGIAHKDIKFGNILFSAVGGNIKVKITDFGLVNSGQKGCTRQFASPEQLDGLIVGTRSDIYSWALVVLKMYIGGRKKSWESGREGGENARELMNSRDNAVTVPDPLKTLLLRCLDEDPSVRPNAKAVLGRLIRIYGMVCGEKYNLPEEPTAAETAGQINNRALSYIDLGEREKAVEYWKKALKIFPNHPESLYNMRICGDVIEFDNVVNTLGVHGIFAGKHREIFGEISRARGETKRLRYIKSQFTIEKIKFSDDNKTIFLLCKDGKTRKVDIETEEISECGNVDFPNNTGDLEYRIGGRTLILGVRGGIFGWDIRVCLGDRKDGVTRMLHSYADIRAPFCFGSDGKMFAACGYPGVDGGDHSIKMFSVPDYARCNFVPSRVMSFEDVLKNSGNLNSLIDKAAAELKSGNYKELTEDLRRIEEIPEFETQWKTIHRLKRETLKKHGISVSNARILGCLPIESERRPVSCVFDRSGGKLAAVYSDGYVEIRNTDLSVIGVVECKKQCLEFFNYVSCWFARNEKVLVVYCWSPGIASEDDDITEYLVYDLENYCFVGKYYDKKDPIFEEPIKPNCPIGLSFSDAKDEHIFSADGAMAVGFDLPLRLPGDDDENNPNDHRAVMYYLDYDIEYSALNRHFPSRDAQAEC